MDGSFNGIMRTLNRTGEKLNSVAEHEKLFRLLTSLTRSELNWLNRILEKQEKTQHNQLQCEISGKDYSNMTHFSVAFIFLPCC